MIPSKAFARSPSHAPLLVIATVAAALSLGRGEAGAKQNRPGTKGGIANEPIVLAGDPPVKAGEKVTLKGKLQGGRMAIGGETTGWQLEYIGAKGAASIEVDASAIKNVATLDGAEVVVTAEVIAKQYVERGSVLILKAASITKADPRAAKS